jgi:hypothetical protein
MAFFGQGNNSLQQSPEFTLADYAHASKTFLPNGYALTPRLKFLFHVYFNINTVNIPFLQAAYSAGKVATIGLMVKSVELPKFKINTAVLNQYNRKRIVQTKLQYEASRITFHDDQSDTIRNMWYQYYSYYYKDAIKSYDGVPVTSGSIGPINTTGEAFNYNISDIYKQLQSADWGYSGEGPSDGTNGVGANGKPQFFNDITIFGFSQKKYAAWVLINPLITDWSSDSYDYSQGDGALTNDMRIEYETVKYYSGDIGGEQPSYAVPGFADPAYYDTVPSPISTEIGRNTVFGQGGMKDARGGSVQDLQALNSGQGGYSQVLGGVQQPNTAYNTLQNVDADQVYGQSVQNNLSDDALGTLPGEMNATTNSPSGAYFPTAPLQYNSTRYGPNGEVITETQSGTTTVFGA